MTKARYARKKKAHDLPFLAVIVAG